MLWDLFGINEKKMQLIEPLLPKEEHDNFYKYKYGESEYGIMEFVASVSF